MKQLLIIQNGSTEMMQLAFDEILYIRSDGNYCVMTLSNGEELQLWMNLKAITELIDQQMRQQEIVFVRVGKQYVLNLHYICRIDTKKDQLSLWRKEIPQKIVLNSISHKALQLLEEGIKQKQNEL
ncbi:LytTR family transcriptional regulator DNA-binding domain-containing protein [Prevotella jejuni]